MRKQGFTLLEMLIVIMILAILSVTVIDSFPKKNLQIQAQAQQLANDLRYAKFRAMSDYSMNGYCVTFTSTSYTVKKSDASNAAAGLCATALTYPGTISLPSGMSMSLPTNSRIVFDHYGQPCSDVNATTPLGANTSIVLSSGTASNTVTISSEGLISSS